MAAALADVEAAGIPGFGQSSWGPTGFALTGDEAQARALAASLSARHPALSVRIARGRNRGAEID